MAQTGKSPAMTYPAGHFRTLLIKLPEPGTRGVKRSYYRAGVSFLLCSHETQLPHKRAAIPVKIRLSQ